jgi:hypothetical protein
LAYSWPRAPESDDLYQGMALELAEKWASEVDLCQGTNLFVPQSF